MNAHWQTKRFVLPGECGEAMMMTPDALLGWVQDIAQAHASLLGFGYESCREKGLAWVEHRLDALVSRWPSSGEEMTIETWTHAQGAVKALRDFRITDHEGKSVILISSQWVLIDVSSRRPVPLKKHLATLDLHGEPSLVEEGGEQPMPASSRFVKTFSVNPSHIDANGHVNNGVYLVWALESMPSDELDSSAVKELHIAFKRETLPGEEVDSLLMLGSASSEHSLVAQGVERARISLVWGEGDGTCGCVE